MQKTIAFLIALEAIWVVATAVECAAATAQVVRKYTKKEHTCLDGEGVRDVFGTLKCVFAGTLPRVPSFRAGSMGAILN